MTEKLTTRDLLDEYFDLQEDLEHGYPETPEELVPIPSAVQSKMKEVEQALFDKLESIQYITMGKKEKQAILQARIDTYTAEVQRLRKKMKALDNAWHRLQWLIMQIVKSVGSENKAGNKQLKVGTDNYTIVHTYGPLEILDESRIPDDYIKLEQRIDKSALRKDIIKMHGEMVDVAICSKIERLKIT